MAIKNKGGFLIKEVNLTEVAKYIKKLPSYKNIVRKIKQVKTKIRKCKKTDIKVRLRSVLSQLREKQKQIITTAFYIKYPNVSVVYGFSKRKK